jgi:hypothetical protein
MAKATTPLTARAYDPVLHRNRRQPCAVCVTAHAMQSVAIKGFLVHESRERCLCDYGQRTRCTPGNPWGCGADLDWAARREQHYQPTREAAMAAFARS